MFRFLVFGSILFGFSGFGFSQASQNEWAQEDISIEELRAQEESEREKAEAYAIQIGAPLEYTTSDGAFVQLVGFHSDGSLKYYITDNRNAAKTISTNKVHLNGGLGLNLEGQNMTIAEWDGGDVLQTHTEVSGRVTDKDGATGVHYHACHVAGTLIARGASTSAKGMAPQAKLWAYDWYSDDSEMRSAALSGILVSNHSYGTVAGWTYNGSWSWSGNTSISSSEDYKFGFYELSAQYFDETARLRPNLLIVKSAGNDRDDGPNQTTPKNDPTYGSVHSQACAKNNLVVASVQDITSGYSGINSVQMSTYSCWGPTDDGRIKPDISANGERVYSMWDGKTKNYEYSLGTSMAAPNAAGSALLIQQHYKNVNNVYGRSATIKGLIIHTADEAGGNEGPDYRFGWGLMNTAKAVQAISSSNVEIEEKTLTSGTKNDIKVSVKGNTWVRITLCWTDWEGTAPSPSLNPTTLMLENDLDVRLIHSDNTTYYPYILNPSVPAAAATKGDNFRDNVEQIYVQVPKAGNYTIRVTHKGWLVGSSQPYSIIYENFEQPNDVTFTMSKRDICKGDTVFFANTTQFAFNSLRWDFQGGHIQNSTSSNPYVVYNSTGRFGVKLNIFQGTQTLDNYDSVNVHEHPEVTILNNKTFCLPNLKYETILADVPTGKWNGYPWMVRTDSCVFRPSSLGAGDYGLKYTFTNLYGCKGSDSTTVKIRNSPTANLYVNPRSVCQGDTPFLLTGGTPTGGRYLVNSSLINQFDPSNYAVGNHEVRYEIEDANGCIGYGLDEILVDICEGIEAGSANADKFQCYPNPFSTGMNIRGDLKAVTQISLTNIFGEKVAEVIGPFKSNSCFLELGNLPIGVYYLTVEEAEDSFIQKVVRQ